MAEPARYYTSAEAGVISGLGRKAIDNAIDKKVIPAPRRPASDCNPAGRKVRGARLISEPELIWVCLNHAARGAIPSEARGELFQRYQENLQASELRVSPVVVLDIATTRSAIAERAARLERAKSNVVSDPEVIGGEPVIRNTRIPVYDVAASVAKGLPSSRIRAAYSLLDDQAIEDAAIYAAAFPPRGRPRSSPKTHPPLKRIGTSVGRRDPPG